MSEHTPGPWAVHGEWITRADEHAEAMKNEYGYQSGHYVAHVVEPIGGREVCNANAHLIAAAPDLLKACEEADRAIRTSPLIRGMGRDDSLYGALMSIYEATEKAKGRPLL